MDKETKEAIAEVLDIIENSDISIKEKIPQEVIDFFENNKDREYIVNLDHSKTLEEMNLKEKTKEFISLIYIKYLCEEDERKEMEKILLDNEIKYQKELKEKYKNENIFEKKKKDKKEKKENKKEQEKIEDKKSNEEVKKEIKMIKSKESFWNKIIKKIKNNILKIKNMIK